MQVTLLVDNLASEGLTSEHGLSFLVETGDGSVLFDTGQSDAWFHNLRKLGHDAGSIRAAAISHGHYDHAGGLAKALQELPGAEFFAHPACFQPKYAQSAYGTRYIGMPAQIVSRKTEFVLNSSSVEIMPGVILSGEMPPRAGPSDFEGRFLTGQDDLVQDTFADEQCVIVKNGRSIALLVGCAHPGLENSVLAGMSVAGAERIELLAGGFHLGNASQARLERLARFLKKLDIGEIACCHCTGIGAYEYLRSKLGPRVRLGRAGAHWEF